MMSKCRRLRAQSAHDPQEAAASFCLDYRQPSVIDLSSMLAAVPVAGGLHRFLIYSGRTTSSMRQNLRTYRRVRNFLTTATALAL